MAIKKNQSVARGNALRAFTPDEVSKRICWHPESVRDACRKGRIPAVRMGRVWRITEATLENIMINGIPQAPR